MIENFVSANEINADTLISRGVKLEDAKNIIGSGAVYISNCERTINSEPTVYKTVNDKLFTACNTVRTNIINLSIAYYVTGDEKHLDRMWLEA